MRNDRPLCRETLLYQHVLPHAGTLVPAYLGSCTTLGGVHVLVLEYVRSRTVNWSSLQERRLALHALADFHASFEGVAVDEALPEALPDAVIAEVFPEVRRRRMNDGDSLTVDPLVFDPGDVRPENCLIADCRVVLIDFENAAVRRRSVALASLVRDCPPAPDLLAPYRARTGAISRFTSG